MKITINPTSSEQLDQWRAKLDQARADYMTQTRNGITSIILDDQVARQVLGIEPEKKKPKWYHYLLLGVLAIWVVMLFIPKDATPVPAPPQKDPQDMTIEELGEYYDGIFGYDGDWVWNYAQLIKANYVNYPRTFRIEDIRVFPIDTDSLTHVLLWSAENAFGQRSDHSVTAVISKDGEVLRIVSAQ